MLEWKDGLPDLPDNSKLPKVVDVLMAIQYSKEKDYGSSWKARGEHRGIIPNIDRKYDRLDKMTEDELSGKAKTLGAWEALLRAGEEIETPESKIDAIADLANYCLLYMTYVSERYPLMYAEWVKKNVPKDFLNKLGN